PLSARPEEPKGGVDIYGDPLPAGAVARMGTMRLRLPKSHFGAIAFSADGQVLAAGADNTLRFWSTTDGRLLRQIKENYEGGTIQFSADGKWLATSAGQAICLLNTATGKLLQRIPVDGVEFAISPDGKLLAIAAKDGAVSVRNTTDGKEVQHWSE